MNARPSAIAIAIAAALLLCACGKPVQQVEKHPDPLPPAKPFAERPEAPDGPQHKQAAVAAATAFAEGKHPGELSLADPIVTYTQPMSDVPNSKGTWNVIMRVLKPKKWEPGAESQMPVSARAFTVRHDLKVTELEPIRQPFSH
jgi:hypothetical protein